jgi:DNA-binding transcriptional LysR family regulator
LVEERLGVPVFARTTRSVALTEAGRALVDGAGPALREIAERLEQVRARPGRVSGLVRLNVPSVALPITVTPLIAAMCTAFPEVRVEVFVDNAMTDIVAAGFDAGIRLGETIAQDMVAVRLTPPFRTVVVASPDYLAARGRPLRLAELEQHACIAYRMVTAGGLYRWELQLAGEDVSVDVQGAVVVNDALYARRLALAGIGLAYLFEPSVRGDIAAGRLCEVLSDVQITEPGFFLYFPRRAALAPKLRALIDTARALPAAMVVGADAMGPD